MREKAKVWSHDQAVLGEGIGLDAMTGRLRWFDIVGGRRLAQNFDEGVTQALSIAGMPSAGAAIDETREMIFTETGLWIFDRERRALVERIAPIEDDRPDLRSNDGRTHPCGAFWGSTMALDQSKGKGSIYWVFKGEVRRLYTDMTVGNAICFSEDGTYAHFSDTPRGTIWRVATHPETGLPDGEPVVFDQAAPDDPGGPDGAVLDRDGFLYSARWGGAEVQVFSPDGRLIRRIETGAPHTTCPAFCGPGLSYLAITSARDGMSPEALAACPDAGKTFLFDAGCRGKLDPPIRLD
ncbi:MULTISPECIES: SMP-30/gluconolactonase/LRE family protein [unclassified Aureimonas]|uniref:SMP-30/gluconolactonase/LRE family protein n=1 Tax=unclassified Aureimonas TaxID=2615206 RepID=UPI0006F26857|nr:MULTISPECIES: SMP-30/gluconolactonase/LRE family protein [unclassified Aureimonas]KQT64102.1 hypothetical protein ASG62_03590 [Aureimonas sp. Leaf427]KQT81292.1 hypothetical protein ASG54_00860 [Aureimonas sp. Leaf460]